MKQMGCMKVNNNSRNANFFYNNDKRLMYAERGILNRISAGDMTEEDGKLIRDFVQFLQFKSNISKGRSYKIISSLCSTSKHIKTPFRQASIYDVYECVNSIKNGALSTNTIRDYLSFLKRFYLWLIDENYCSIPIEKIQEMKTPKGQKITKSANDILTRAEIEEIIQHCSNSRDRLLISLIYEGAFRIGEIAVMKWKDLDFSNSDCVVIHVNFKTGIDRFIPIYESKDLIFHWIRDYYKGDPQPEDNVFITKQNMPFQYDSLRMRIMKLIKRANIEKKITPHSFRHSRITHMVQGGWQETIIKLIAWGNLESAQFKVYCHLSQADIIAEAGRHCETISSSDNNIQSQPVLREAKTCTRCFKENPPGQKYCIICGKVLK